MSSKKEEQPLTGRMREDREPVSLKEYEAGGGYQAVRKVLGRMSPGEVIEEVKKSNLRGRGGAGFPTGMKWGFVPTGENAPQPKYVVANADEMEPGTFKDRLLMERDPHLLIEGCILCAYAIQARFSFIFLRWAYKTSQRALERAVAEAYEAGYLGKNILGSDLSLDVHLHMSSGRYMCGEETGLLNSLEGRQATPRSKPPYPGVSGLFGQPTVVNNVETLSSVPGIIRHGAQWFKELSRTEDGGSKIYGVSGRVKHPGAWELPMGTTLGELLDRAGGFRDGLKFRGALPGGASTSFLVDEHLDLPLDFTATGKAGKSLGTGCAIVLDDGRCPVGMLVSLEHFFAQESCGWCTPCREGLPWIEKTLTALEEGQGLMEDIERLKKQAKLLSPGHTFCALAPGAAMPLGSGLEYFEDDFRRHVEEKRCPWK
jgi:NADH-quinone oxidoreductase subunit F